MRGGPLCRQAIRVRVSPVSNNISEDSFFSSMYFSSPAESHSRHQVSSLLQRGATFLSPPISSSFSGKPPPPIVYIDTLNGHINIGNGHFTMLLVVRRGGTLCWYTHHSPVVRNLQFNTKAFFREKNVELYDVTDDLKSAAQLTLSHCLGNGGVSVLDAVAKKGGGGAKISSYCHRRSEL